MKYVPSALCLVLFALTGLAAAQDEPKPTVSLKPLSTEQLSIYHALLAGFMDQDTPQVNLADRTVPFGATGPASDESCGKDLDLEPMSPTLVHQFRLADLAQLSSDKINLVNRSRGEKNVKDNDPWAGIQQGHSVEDSVRNGFAHGLFTFSEIQFDKSHTHAIVSYSFVCGRLCGNGAEVVLEKTETGWRLEKRCGVWISRTVLARRCATGSPS